ncbi:MAG: prepilin peptidase [Bacillota bacterium]|nr:prepilin peptidase [Bacillota bacterium]
MWTNFLLFSLLTICVFTDIKERKIYNSILFPFLCAAWILHVVIAGETGLKETLLGTAVGLCILLIPYLLGGMGAGDVKLLAVIGAIKGMDFVLMASVYMAFTGGGMAILILLFRKGVRARMMQIMYVLHGLRNGVKTPMLSEKEGIKTTYPYGIAIALGAIFQAIKLKGITL